MKILYNARIHTLNKAKPIASALAVDYGRILAVGETDEIFREFDRAERQDMGGKVVLPGLTDAHIHLQEYALLLQKVDCETDSKEECLRRVAERARKLRPDEWLLGHGWNQNFWASPLLGGDGRGGLALRRRPGRDHPRHPHLSHRQVHARRLGQWYRVEAGRDQRCYTRSPEWTDTT